MNEYNINEIFYSIQGEGTRSGKPCVFVRLQGCNLRCSWCDTQYAIEMSSPEARTMSQEEIEEEIKKYECKFVEFTGGEPLINRNLADFMKKLCDDGYTVAVETNGSQNISKLDPRIVKIIDVKCPNSGEQKSFRRDMLPYITSSDEIKFVVADMIDLEFAKQKIEEYQLEAIGCEIIISPVKGKIEYAEIVDYILQNKINARFQVQLHKIIWSEEMRGV